MYLTFRHQNDNFANRKKRKKNQICSDTKNADLTTLQETTYLSVWETIQTQFVASLQWTVYVFKFTLINFILVKGRVNNMRKTMSVYTEIIFNDDSYKWFPFNMPKLQIHHEKKLWYDQFLRPT